MRTSILVGAATLIVLTLSACETVNHRGYRVTVESPATPPPPVVVVQERRGPPPHAPAHGYRHKHHDHGHDIDLVFDAGVGCYAVVGYRDYYYNDGFYFRIGSDGWQISASFGDSARWEPCPDRRLPGGLKVKYKDHPSHGKGKGPGKGKGNKKFSAADHWGKFGA